MSKPKSKPDPLKSLGARLERKAMRAFLRRELRSVGSAPAGYVNALTSCLSWVDGRAKRCGDKVGGLGRK